MKLLFALPVVILLAYISLRLTNQYLSKQGRGKNIQILERVPLNNKSALCVVKAGQDYLVLGISENNIQVIKKLEAEEVIEHAGLNQDINFKEALSMNLKKLKKEKSSHE